MAPTWPVDEFREYLRMLMTAAHIPDFAELSRLTGVSQTQLSNWRRGLAQPSKESLKRISPALGVQPVRLYLAAGVNDAEELDISDQVDFTVLPAEIRDFIDLYLDERLSEDQRRYARQTVAYIASGIRAELAKSPIKPSGRRRAG